MRILNSLCFAVLSLAFAAAPVAAADRAVAPLPPAECTQLAHTISKILTGVELTATENARPTVIWEDLLVSGTGCRFTGSVPVAKLSPQFPYAPTAEAPALHGWKDILEVAADGPDSGIGGLSKGNKAVLYAWNATVPEEVCRKAKDVEACEEANASKAIYHFEAIAFSFADGHPIGSKDFKQYE